MLEYVDSLSVDTLIEFVRLGTDPRALIEDLLLEDELTVKWIRGVRKWWQQWVDQGMNKIVNLRGKEAYKPVMAWLEDGKGRVKRIRDNLFHMKDLRPWSHTFTGDKKKDVPKRDTSGGFGYAKLIKSLVYDFDSAINYIGDTRSKIYYEYGLLYGPRSVEYNSKTWGRNKDLDMLDARIEGLFDYENDDIPRANNIMLGVFSKLIRFVNKLTKLGLDAPGKDVPEYPPEFDIHGVTVVVNPGSLSPQALAGDRKGVVDPRSAHLAVKYISKAYDILRRNKLESVWYGAVFVWPKRYAPQSQKAKSKEYFKAGGNYYPDKDIINVYVHPNQDFMVTLLLHELGHRYYYLAMKPQDRRGFDKWFDIVAATTAYGSESTVEDFAEVFADYLLGKPNLTREQVERFKYYAFPGGKPRKCRR